MQKNFLIRHNEFLQLTLEQVVEFFCEPIQKRVLNIYINKNLDESLIKDVCLQTTLKMFQQYDIKTNQIFPRLLYQNIEKQLNDEALVVNGMAKKLLMRENIVVKTFEQIMLDFEPLCIKFSKKYFFDNYDIEDIKQICYIELFRTYDTYDINKGIEFNTVCFKFIKTKLDNILRNENVEKRRLKSTYTFIELTQPLGDSDGATYLEAIPDKSVNVELQIVNSTIIKLINEKLTNEDRLILPVIMGLKTQKQYSIEQGISAVAGLKRVRKLESKLQSIVNFV